MSQDATPAAALLVAIERYLQLMYDGDVAQFDAVFAPTAQLHGLRGGKLRMMPAADFKAALSTGPSAQSKAAPRRQEILLVDFASPTQALAKVRVRMDVTQYIDYLSYHCIDGVWLITAKSYHIEQKFDAA